MALHSVFGDSDLSPSTAIANDGAGSIVLGNVFYVEIGSQDYICRGAKLWLPTGATLPAQVTIEARYDVSDSATNNLDSPALRSVTIPATGLSGWQEVSWPAFVVEPGKMVLISYTFSGGQQVYLYRSEANSELIPASDGTPLCISEMTVAPYSSGYFRVNGGAVQKPFGTFVYGVDIIIDDSLPLAEYGFNELTGVNTTDETPYQRDLTVNSASNFDVSRTGNGLHQVGGGLANRIANSTPWLETPQRTLMFWGRRGDTGASLSRTVYQVNGSGETTFGVGLSDGAQMEFTVRVSGVPVTITYPAQAVGDWHHYALTYDQQTLSAYIDGVVVGAQAAAGSIDASDGQLYFYGEEYQQQVVDDLRFFEAPLSETEIQNYMAQTIAPPDLEPPTVPANLAATVAYQQVGLTWTLATDNVAVQNYVVYRSETSGFTPTLTDQVGGPSSASYSDIAPVGTHYYRVAARDEAGNESAASPECVVTTTQDPGVDYLYPSALGWTPGSVYVDGTTTGMSFGTFFGLERPASIKGVRFYSPAAASGAAIHLTEDNSTILAQASSLDVAVGWNTFLFDSPYVGVFGIGYVVSIHIPGATVSYTALTNAFDGTRTQVGPAYSQNPLSGRYSYNAELPSVQVTSWFGVDVVVSSEDTPLNTAYGTDIVSENALPGSSSEGWMISGAGDTTNLGFARQFSVNIGETVDFSCHGTGPAIDIYRIGAYGGMGWRKVATIANAATQQPDPDVVPDSNGGVTCTNWSTTASWTVPTDAISGLFVGVYRNTSQTNASYIPFSVRDDAKAVDVIVKFSETTWALAYNYYGTPSSPLTGKSVYGSGGPLGDSGTRSHVGSYHRPIVTREGIPQTYWLACEAPLIRFIESNGLNVKYVASKDVDESPAILQAAKMVISSGHDEYWSEGMRDAFEAYRDGGGHVIFMSGNEVFWRTRFSPDHTLMWVYKDTMDGPGAHVGGTALDPVGWTGTWKDTRWAGRRPEHTITGTDFRMNGVNDIAVTFDHTAGYASHPFWRDTAVAGGASVTVNGIIGFEADEIAPTQPTPSTAILAQQTVNINGARADDNGQSYNGNGDLQWGVVSQRYGSGAVVVGFGTCQWAWGLDATHDRGGVYTSAAVQQATLNLFADLGAVPATTLGGLVTPTPVGSLDVYGVNPLNVRSGKVKVWSGSVWQSHPLKVWDGSSWVVRPAAGHDGTEFIRGK